MTKAIDHRIPYAVGPAGNPVSIYDVPRGLACACTCPACHAPLVARQGERRRKVWHFAHASGTNCAGALESSIHLAVKTIIEQERRLLVPPCHVLRYPPDLPYLPKLDWTREGEYIVAPYRYTRHPDSYLIQINSVNGASASFPDRPVMIQFDQVLVEQKEGDIQPDLIGVAGERRLYIEVAVTHPINGEKLLKIRARQTPTVQILVPYKGQALSWDQLRTYLLESLEGKAWAFNPRTEALADEAYARREAKRLADAQQKAKLEADFQRWKQREAERAEQARQVAEQDAREQETRRKKEAAENELKPAAVEKPRAYEATFNGLFGGRIKIRLGASYVTLEIKHANATLAKLVGEIAQQFHGLKGSDQFAWNLLGTVENFFEVANAVRATGMVTEMDFSHPAEISDSEFLRRCGYHFRATD